MPQRFGRSGRLVVRLAHRRPVGGDAHRFDEGARHTRGKQDVPGDGGATLVQEGEHDVREPCRLMALCDGFAQCGHEHG